MAAQAHHHPRHAGGRLLGLVLAAVLIALLALAWSVWSDGLLAPETSRLAMDLRIPDALPVPTPMPDPQPTPMPVPTPQPR